jgi:hypothetical protein
VLNEQYRTENNRSTLKSIECLPPLSGVEDHAVSLVRHPTKQAQRAFLHHQRMQSAKYEQAQGLSKALIW